MKFLILAAFLAVAVIAAEAAPAQPKFIAILKALNEADDDGGFNYHFESEDDIKVEATGSQRQVGPKAEDKGTVSRGSYSYIAPDGTPISMTWTADENGFRPVGSHLPVAPPMPDYVIEMLANIKNQKATGYSGSSSSQTSYKVQEIVKQAPAPQVVYVQQQEVKEAPQQQVTYVQEIVKQAPAPQVMYVHQQEVKEAPQQQVTYVQEIVKQDPAPQVVYVQQQEVKEAPQQQVTYVQEIVKQAPPQVMYVHQQEVKEAPQQQVTYVKEIVKSAPAQETRVDTYAAPAKKSSSGRQIFRVTFPESASK